MGITKPVELKNKERDEYISKGGDVSSDKKEGDFKFIQLRVPIEMLDKIHELNKKRPWITTTAWILDAMQNKLEKENL